MNIEESVIQQGIASDVAYAGRIVRDLGDTRYAPFTSIVSFCMTPYLSLIAYESYRKLEGTDPALAALLSNDVRAIVERSRHSLKLFEDTHRGIDGQIAYFRDEILPAHHSYFIDRVWLPPARRFAKNLGFFSYDNKVITSTHGATFHMGIGPRELLTMKAHEVRAIYEQYGRYFQRLGAGIDSNDPTFIPSLDPQRFNQRPDDARAESYYPSVFNGAATSYLNAVLTVFRGMMNFVNSVIVADTKTGAVEYTVFKIRFLTLYQIIGSLKLLRDEQTHALTGPSVSFIDKITGTAETQLIMQRAAKPFRNTLMHYNLNPRVDTTRVDIDQPLFGLVPIYFPSYDVATFIVAVDQCISETTAFIEQWAGI